VAKSIRREKSNNRVNEDIDHTHRGKAIVIEYTQHKKPADEARMMRRIATTPAAKPNISPVQDHALPVSPPVLRHASKEIPTRARTQR